MSARWTLALALFLALPLALPAGAARLPNEVAWAQGTRWTYHENFHGFPEAWVYVPASFSRVAGRRGLVMHFVGCAQMPYQATQGAGWPEAAEAFDACDFAACGAGGACAEVAVGDGNGGFNQAGCACAEGMLARAGIDPAGLPFVSCGDARLNFTAVGLDNGPVSFPDACAANTCGDNGECVMLNGFPSCRCATGYVAVAIADAEGMPSATCAAPIAPLPANVLAGLTVREPNLPYPGRVSPMEPYSPMMPPVAGDGGGMKGSGGGGCTSTPGAPGAPAGLIALLLALPFIRRRR